MLFLSIITILFAYLLGSISSATVCCKLMDLPDPRTSGSKNPGATNVLRLGGKKAAVFTLLGDSLKAVIPVLAAKLLGIAPLLVGFVALAAFLGHVYPIFYKFSGGKGVATLFGALIALWWPLGLAAIATWLFVAIVFRYSSLAALITALLTPAYTFWWDANASLLPIAIMCIILIAKHHTNIRRLLAGTESKIGQK